MRAALALVSASLVILCAATSCTSPQTLTSSAPPSGQWNPQQAANYLDRREIWWQQWPRAQKDHGTLCISCHTTLPYALVRPALRRQLH